MSEESALPTNHSITFNRIDYKVQPSTHLYNIFFHPSVCHVCKFGDAVEIIRCYNCHMIAYCCEKHMMTDRPHHEEICRAMRKLTRAGKMKNFSGGTRQEWFQRKKRYVRLVQEELDRPLLPHEEDMLLFARSCETCHRETDLDTCPACLSIDYCQYHCKLENSHKCVKLRDWLFSEIKATTVKRYPERQKFVAFSRILPFDDMVSFCDRFFVGKRLYKKWLFTDYVNTDYLSGPLTLYNSLREAQILEAFEATSPEEYTYIVHIVNATHRDRLYAPSWEILLHLFCGPTKLVVIMVGATLMEECDNLQICMARCTGLGYHLHLLCHGMSYHDYVNSPLYRKPDVIVGYHVKLNDGETWAQLVPALQVSYCPVILTVESEVKMGEYLSRIREVLGEDVKPLIASVNEFDAKKRHRDCETGEIYCRNSYVIVYKDLVAPCSDNAAR